MLMQVIHLRGLLFETADTDELNYRKRLRDAMLQAIGSSRFALYHHIIRRRVDVELAADHPDPFSRAARRGLAGAARDQAALRQRAVPDPDPPPAAGPGRRLRPARAALFGRARRRGRAPTPPTSCASSTPPATPCSPRSAVTGRGCSASTRPRRGPAPSRSNSSPRSTMARCARCCCRCRISAPICPIAGSASARRRSSSARPAPSPAQLPRPGLDQGLSRPDRARHARRAAAPAVRADRLAELRLRRAPGGARRG